MSLRVDSPVNGPWSDRPVWQGYGFGLLALVAALLVRGLLDPLLGEHLPLATLLIALPFVVAFGGWKPGVMVCVFGYFAANLLFVAPRLTLTAGEVLGAPRIAVYFIACATIIVLLSRLRAARRKHAVSEARALAILESMRESFCAVDPAWRITAVNRRAESALRRARTELIGRTLWDVVPQAIGQTAETNLRRALRDHATVEFETQALVSGSWHAVTATPIVDGLSIFFEDITDAKIHVGQLEQQVNERTAALQGLVAELEAFSYTLVHDMRAPLRSISSFAELIAVDHARQLDADGRSYLERIRKAAARMDRLITAIMDYSQLARTRPDLRPVDLHHLLQEILESYAGFKSSRTDIGIVGVLPIVRGNEALLTQCFSNLLHNAIKFVAPGVIPRIRISAQVKDDVARIEIADNGLGIAPEAAERVFEPFRREHPNYDGTGIGLAIVRKVVELMDGRIGVVSQVGSGSRFWIELKLARPAETPDPSRSRAGMLV